MSSIWSGSFWKGTAERVVASIAGGALTITGTNLFNVTELDFGQVAAVAAGAGLVSLLKAVAATAATGTLSLTGAETPSAVVVEKVKATDGADKVVAGPANDVVRPGTVVRTHKAEGQNG